MGSVRATGCLRSVGEELRPMSRLAASAVPIGAELAMRKKKRRGGLDDPTHIILHFSMPGVW